MELLGQSNAIYCLTESKKFHYNQLLASDKDKIKVFLIILGVFCLYYLLHIDD